MMNTGILRSWWAVIVMILMGIPPEAWGMDHMGHGSMSGHEAGRLKKVTVEGIQVVFYLEPMAEHRKAMEKMGMAPEGSDPEMKKEMEAATHHLSVSFQDARTMKAVEKAEGTVTVTGPSGPPERGPLHWMEAMKHFGSCLALKDAGTYHISLSFTIDGRKRDAGFDYDLHG